MAATYTVVSSRRTTQVLSPTKVLDVMVVGVETVPSGVYFERAVPYTDWVKSPAGVDFYAAPPADNIEYELAQGTVIAASYIEDLDASGLVQGFIEFVLQVPSPGPTKPGPFQTTVDVPIAVVSQASLSGPGIFYAPFNNALAALQQTAAL
jgi:hypothetical protein